MRNCAWISVMALFYTWATYATGYEEAAVWGLMVGVIVGLISWSRLGFWCVAIFALTFFVFLALEWHGDEGWAPTSEDTKLRRFVPRDATNIAYALKGPNDLYEFDTTEQNYRAWVAESKPKMDPPREKQDAQIFRYNPATRKTERRGILRALVSDWTGESPDHGVHMYYDLDAHRAYYWYHSR